MIKTVHLIVSTEHTKTLNRSLHKAAVSVCQIAGLHVHETDVYELYHNQHPAILPYGIDISDSDHDDIAIEQNKMQSAELIIVQFPLYWFSMPGLLKNYFDRVWEKGFAYADKIGANPLLNGRNILFSITTELLGADFAANTHFGTMKELLFPLERACQSIGLEFKTPFICFGAHQKPEHEIEDYIQTYKKHIETMIGKSVVCSRPLA